MEEKEEKKIEKESQRADPDFIDCDSPPYGIVKACACKKINLERPLDVRWESWGKACKDRDPTKPGICVICSGGISPLHTWEFTYKNQTKVKYSMTQCSKCKTVFWK